MASSLAAAAILALFAAISNGEARLAASHWGGEHVGMEVTDQGARLDFDCAHGTIEGPIVLGEGGRFEVAGVFVKETPGPVRPDGLKGEAARYLGHVAEGGMTLDVVLSGSGESAGSFTLQRDRLPRVRKCQ